MSAKTGQAQRIICTISIDTPPASMNKQAPCRVSCSGHGGRPYAATGRLSSNLHDKTGGDCKKIGSGALSVVTVGDLS